MGTLLSISLIVAVTLWAGMALATILGRLFTKLLPFMKVPAASAERDDVAREPGMNESDNELALVA